MTAQPHHLPAPVRDDSNVVQFPAKPLVAARAEIVAAAHAVLRSPEPQTVAAITTACRHLRDWGAPADHVLADQFERALMQQRAERADAVPQSDRPGTIRRALWETTAFALFAVAVLVVGGAL